MVDGTTAVCLSVGTLQSPLRVGLGSTSVTANPSGALVSRTNHPWGTVRHASGNLPPNPLPTRKGKPGGESRRSRDDLENVRLTPWQDKDMMPPPCILRAIGQLGGGDRLRSARYP